MWLAADVVASGPDTHAAPLRVRHMLPESQPQLASASGAVPKAPAVERPAFRVLSYNLLADQYAASEYAQTVRLGSVGSWSLARLEC
jgi:hypothetical protein